MYFHCRDERPQLRKSQLRKVFGAYLAEQLMGFLGPAATGFAKVRATVAAPPLVKEGGWPTAVFTHSLTGWRHINSSYLVEIVSNGCVALALEHCDQSACVAVANESSTTLATFVDWDTDKRAEFEANKVHDPWAAGRDWRRGQCDQRRLEVLVRCAFARVDGSRRRPSTASTTRSRGFSAQWWALRAPKATWPC